MNVLVAYSTQTGNTKKVADAIYGEIAETKQIEQLAALEGLAALVACRSRVACG
jgi:flavodoxin